MFTLFFFHIKTTSSQRPRHLSYKGKLAPYITPWVYLDLPRGHFQHLEDVENVVSLILI